MMFSDHKILRFFFRLTGVPSFVINKGRSEKRSVISGERKDTVETFCGEV